MLRNCIMRFLILKTKGNSTFAKYRYTCLKVTNNHCSLLAPHLSNTVFEHAKFTKIIKLKLH